MHTLSCKYFLSNGSVTFFKEEKRLEFGSSDLINVKLNFVIDKIDVPFMIVSITIRTINFFNRIEIGISFFTRAKNFYAFDLCVQN